MDSLCLIILFALDEAHWFSKGQSPHRVISVKRHVFVQRYRPSLMVTDTCEQLLGELLNSRRKIGQSYKSQDDIATRRASTDWL
jgi:hypothetical protein